MTSGFTIPMARALLQEGRAREVGRMIEPLLDSTRNGELQASRCEKVVLHALIARTQLLEYGDVEAATARLALAETICPSAEMDLTARAELTTWKGWATMLDESVSRPVDAAALFSVACDAALESEAHETYLWATIGLALTAHEHGAPRLASVHARRAWALQSVLRSEQAQNWIDALPKPLPVSDPHAAFDDFVGGSSTASVVRMIADSIAADRVPALIAGERGSGRRHLARLIHRATGGSDRGFVSYQGGEPGAWAELRQSMNDAAGASDVLTLCLVDVELLDHEAQNLALNLAANHGALILAVSGRSLTALRITRALKPELVAALGFAQVNVPPLRHRKDDIILLTRHFLRALRRSQGLPPAITDDAISRLSQYAWPGNVRQLRNEIERVLLHLESEPAPVVRSAILSDEVRGPERLASDEADLDHILAQTERHVIDSVLAQTGGQVAAAAETLGVTRQGLYKKMKRLGVDPSRHQEPRGDQGSAPSASSASSTPETESHYA